MRYKLSKPTILLIAVAAISTVTMPSLAMAAEGGAQETGSWFLFGCFVINFALFAWVLIKFAMPPARKFFAGRAAGIKSNFDRATGALTEAQDLANRAAVRAAGLEAEVAAMIADLEAETKIHIKRITDGAQATVDRVKADARMSAGALADAAQRGVRARLASAASSLARDLIAKTFSDSDQHRLIDGFMERLGHEARQ